MDIVFVILHYMTTDITKKAIEHINENCDTPNYRIIVVDNASPNDSYSELRNWEGLDDKVILIQNEENLGFAKGNNVGIQYAKQRFHPRFIAVINNDVYITERNLFHKLQDEYRESKFAVAGPKIWQKTKEGEQDDTANPHILNLATIKFTKYAIKSAKYDYFWSKMRMYEIARRVRRLASKLHIIGWPEHPKLPIDDQTDVKEEPLSSRKLYNVGLFGCCFFLSEEYIKNYDGFDERTFLYGEEEVLLLHMLADGKKMVYLPDIEVFHVGHAATNAVDGNKKIDKLFYSIKSLEVILDIQEKYKKEHGRELYKEICKKSANIS